MTDKNTPYLIPVGRHRTELMISNSRFITTVDFVETTEDTRAFLHEIRAEMPDATHHVHAFRVGFGNSVIEGMSDDGEPTGTSGPPALAVLRGTDIGDCMLVITRYFGGTKLGTGGLVRAYGDSARTALASLPTELKIKKQTLGIETPYSFYDQIVRLIGEHAGVIEDQSFTGDVTIFAIFPVSAVEEFSATLKELTAGQVMPFVLD
jgi:uncharacterized YigZ family protein